jgi:hypothetical protein
VAADISCRFVNQGIDFLLGHVFGPRRRTVDAAKQAVPGFLSLLPDRGFMSGPGLNADGLFLLQVAPEKSFYYGPGVRRKIADFSQSIIRRQEFPPSESGRSIAIVNCNKITETVGAARNASDDKREDDRPRRHKHRDYIHRDRTCNPDKPQPRCPIRAQAFADIKSSLVDYLKSDLV